MNLDAKRTPSGPAGGAIVYKICPLAAWQRACIEGELAPSRDDARDGYVHLSAPEQVRGTLDRHFAGQSGLVLLVIASARLPEAALRWEPSRDGQLFPHLYARFQVGFVSESVELTCDADGRIELPEPLHQLCAGRTRARPAAG